MPSATASTEVKHDAAGVLHELLTAAAGRELPEWPRVQAAIKVRELMPGAVLFRQGDVHPVVYAVNYGLLKLCYLGDDGSEWVKSFAYEGRYFASVAALQPGGVAAFTVSAIEPSRVERIDYALLTSLATQHLPWALALQAMTMQFAVRKERRERELLTLTPEQRYLAFRAELPHLVARIPQKDLARFFGITPVGLNRIVMRIRRRESGAGCKVTT